MIILIGCLVEEYLFDLTFLPDLKDQFKDLLQPPFASVMKDCPSVRVLLVDVGPAQNQSLNWFDIPLLLKRLDCLEKGKCPKDSLFLVDFLPARKQKVHILRVSRL